MGVKGLTSFIAKNAEQYMSPFDLHDCNLVIDGDNLACNLYKDVSECNSAFGGDYDKYYRTVIRFFHLLSKCNVRSFVILDGGYEKKKMRTVQSRLRGKIGAIKHINPSNSKPIFPLMMREVFVDALKDSGVHYMRCTLEADEELAALARCLNCPVLSYDSDFYVFDVKYIPLITLRMEVLEKVNFKNNRDELRLCEKRHLRKKYKKQMNEGLPITTTYYDEEENKKLKKNKLKTYKYLDCCLYRIENLLEKGKLDKEKLPLFAALLGNDYINVKLFRAFYSQVGVKGVSKKVPKHQKRIMVILKWLRHESKQSAMEKILSKMKKDQRIYLLRQMQLATDGYLNQKCISFKYFNLTENDKTADDLLEGLHDSEEPEDEISSESDVDEGDISSSENEDELSQISGEVEKSLSGDDSECHDNPISSQQSLSESNENFSLGNDESVSAITTIRNIPQDILNLIHSASVPRYVNDLLNLNLYINNPQVESFLLPDCNEIAIPILLKIYAYLHYPYKPELRYLTRVVRLTNCVYKRISIDDLEFNKETILEDIFTKDKMDFTNLKLEVQRFPSDIRYYLILLIYWANKSKNCDEFHIHALLICLVVLRFIDTRIEPIKDEKKFKKLHGKKIQKEKQLRYKNLSQDSAGKENDSKTPTKTKELLNKLSIFERIYYIPKIDIIMLQENLLKYYIYQENHTRKVHTPFSSTIIHGFSEFQAVLYQMYTLNALLNYPFEQLKLSNLYSGLFLYNIYTNLSQRIEIQHHIKNFIFRDAEIIYEYYQKLGELCEKYIPKFKLIKNISETKVTKKIKKKIVQLKTGVPKIIYGDTNDPLIPKTEFGRELKGAVAKVLYGNKNDPDNEPLIGKSDAENEKDAANEINLLNNKFGLLVLKNKIDSLNIEG